MWVETIQDKTEYDTDRDRHRDKDRDREKEMEHFCAGCMPDSSLCPGNAMKLIK